MTIDRPTKRYSVADDARTGLGGVILASVLADLACKAAEVPHDLAAQLNLFAGVIGFAVTFALLRRRSKSHADR